LDYDKQCTTQHKILKAYNSALNARKLYILSGYLSYLQFSFLAHDSYITLPPLAFLIPTQKIKGQSSSPPPPSAAAHAEVPTGKTPVYTSVQAAHKPVSAAASTAVEVLAAAGQAGP